MTIKPIIPPGAEALAARFKASAGVIAGDFIFLTGMTGSAPDGRMPAEPKAQFRAAFDKVAAVLAEAAQGMGTLVEMTSYHVDIDRNFDDFADVRAEYVAALYPTWTAVGVAALRRPGALVEIRAIAARAK